MTILGTLTAAAQNQIPAPALNAHPHFEVASIKPSKPGAVMQDMRIAVPPGRFEATNITLNELLLSFTGFSGRVEGGDKWVMAERYDIVAKAASEITHQERAEMIMALLKDRFKLAVHDELKQQSGMALLIGKTPPNLKPGKDGETTSFRSEGRKIVCQSVNMFSLAGYLSQILRVAVVDHTQMKGKFDFTLDSDRVTPTTAYGGPGGDTFADRLGPAVEDLGLRLEPRQVSINLTVIDHAERPTEN